MDQDSHDPKPLLTIAIPTYNRAQFLRELLNSLTGQISAEARVELLISDNASDDETAAIINDEQRKGTQLRYIRNAENIGPDANFLQCYECAAGKYVWLIGDDDFLLPGAVAKILDYLSKDEYDLVYVSPAGFAGDASEVRPVRSSRRAVAFTDAAQFVRRVHIFTTLISSNIVNKSRVELVEHKPFTQLINTNLIQLGWTFTALRGHRKSLFIQEKLVAYRVGNTGGYGVCRVFGTTLVQVTQDWLGIPRLNRLILNATVQRFFPGILLAMNRGTHGSFYQEDPHRLLSSLFGNNIRYWFFDYPLIVLPFRLAWCWLQLLRIINRIDRACGLPLLGY